MNALVNLTDQQLITSYLTGNNVAFEVLLRRYKNDLFASLMQLVHNQELAEDFFQETFLKVVLLLRSGNYVDNGKFYALLYRIARNLVLDYYRRQHLECVPYDRYSADEERSGYDLLNDARLCEQNIEQELVNEQVLRDAVAVMQALPEEQREIVRMRIYEEMSFRDIAEREHISINTALGRMRYAVHNMRKLVAESGLSLDME